MKPRAILGWIFVAVATYAAVFVLPYRFPLRVPVLSEVWDAGANNQVAAIAAAILSVIVSLVCWRRPSAESEPEVTGALSRRYLVAGVVAVILWTASLGIAVARAQVYWGDEGYFLNQLRSGLVFHRHIYTQFEFAYGPLLYLWPAVCIRVLGWLGISFNAAYLVSLAMMQAAGVALLFYTVQALPLRRSLKAFAFTAIAFRTMNTLLGLNYSVFRFILPFAAATLLSRQRTVLRAALVAGFGEILCMATSPEIGLSFGAAAIAFMAYRAYTDGRLWLIALAAPIAGAVGSVALIGPAYFSTLTHMARGGFNLLLLPAPHLLVLLAALMVFAPIAVVRSLRSSLDGALILAFYMASLAMIPAAVGRCDPIHAFFDGLGVYLLGFVTLNRFSAQWRRGWLVVGGVIFTLVQVSSLGLYREQFKVLFRPGAMQPDQDFDEAALRRAIGDAQIAAPLLAPQRVLDDMTATGQYVPGYFCGWVGVWDEETEAHKIADMRSAPFALVSMTDPVGPDPQRDRRVALAMRLALVDRGRQPEHYRLLSLGQELAAHWTLRSRFGDYLLFERRE